MCNHRMLQTLTLYALQYALIINFNNIYIIIIFFYCLFNIQCFLLCFLFLMFCGLFDCVDFQASRLLKAGTSTAGTTAVLRICRGNAYWWSESGTRELIWPWTSVELLRRYTMTPPPFFLKSLNATSLCALLT